MKKFLFTSLMACMVLVLAACGGSEETGSGGGNGDIEKLNAPVEFLKIGSGPMGSGWYPLTTILSEVYMDNFEGLNVSQIEGASVSNMEALKIGDVKFAVNYASTYSNALEGEGSFEEPIKNIAAFGSLYPVFQQIATLADNEEINEVEDIVDKHIFLGPKGGGSPVAFWQMMAEYGITKETVKEAGGQISYGNYSDGATMLKDGIVDVFVGGGAPQIVSLQEIEVTRPVKVIPLDKDKLESIDSKGLGVSYAPLPAGTYKGQEEDIPTYTLVTMFTVSKDLSEEFVYNMSKVFWNNIDRWEQQLPERAKYFTIDTATAGIGTETLHPGAAKYLKEIDAIE
jgi:TRAP transporter TAXI family solute receptor